MNKENQDAIAVAAVAGALIWGVWSLVPLAIGVLAAFIAIVAYGVSAFSVPSWALGTGSASIVFASSVFAMLRPAARAPLREAFIKLGMFALALFVAVGAGAALLAIIPSTSLMDPDSSRGQVRSDLAGMVDGLKTFYAWLVILVIPAALAAIAGHQLLRSSRSI